MKLSKEILKSLVDLITNLTGKGQEEISLAAGYSKTSITSILSKGVVSPKMIEKIELTFKEELKNSTYFEDKIKNVLSSVEIKDPQKNSYLSDRLNKKNNPIPMSIKLFDANIAATPNAGNNVKAVTERTDHVNIYDVLGRCDFALQVSGNSMMPNYPPSSIVGMIRKTDSIIRVGEVYGVETADDIVLKRLYYKDDDSMSDILVLISDNAHIVEHGARKGKLSYPPQELHKKDIKALYSITGSAKIMRYEKKVIQL